MNKLKISIDRDGVEDTTFEAKAKDPKKFEAKDSPSEYRPSRGKGQECSRPGPRTQVQVISKNKKCLQKVFSADLQKRNTLEVFPNFPRGFWRFPTQF